MLKVQLASLTPMSTNVYSHEITRLDLMMPTRDVPDDIKEAGRIALAKGLKEATTMYVLTEQEYNLMLSQMIVGKKRWKAYPLKA